MSRQPLGDAAFRFARPSGIGARTLFDGLRRQAGVVDVVITEEHVAVTFDPAHPPHDVASLIDRVSASDAEATPVTEHLVHVRYDGEDLGSVAERLGLSPAALVEGHTQRVYEVKLIGFQPGFAYLGDLEPALQLPRRDTPRVRVPPKSIAIAERYTAIYPFASPGGWHLLGTAIDFEPLAFALALGDHVRFEAV
jgi:UPF0271 protein